MVGPAITVAGLRKSYGNTEAVAGIDLYVRQGEVFALLGPNGAGKTTTVEILEGHRSRSGGSVDVLGHDPARNERLFKQRIGIVLQRTGVEPYLTVEETVRLFGGYYSHPRPVEETLKVTGLSGLRRQRVRKLSGGQQRRLDVAVGLAGDPELLFLDEPTTGFDPLARRGAWEMVKNLQALGKTVFLTTHYMDEAEYLANRVALIVQGRIVAGGPPRELMLLDAVTTIKFRLDPQRGDLPADFPAPEYTDGGVLTMRTSSPEKVLYGLTSWALENGVTLQELTVSRPSLEDTYLKLVQQANERVCARAQADRLREQGLLAQPGCSLLYLRVSPHVPSHLQPALW